VSAWPAMPAPPRRSDGSSRRRSDAWSASSRRCLTSAQVGLLDQDGRGRIDALVDVPAKDVFRVTRLRADGVLGVDVFEPAMRGG
jgi:hypothetical protein